MILRNLAVLGTCLLLSASAALAVPAGTTVGSGVAGSAGFYDYSPSVLQTGQLQDLWWCGDWAPHQTDTIFHMQYSWVGGLHVSVPQRAVLLETPGAWDAGLICNPSVVRGSFANPLGDGATYTYAMYYVGIADGDPGNEIGAAFSLDGDNWVKAAGPVLPFTDGGHGYYGNAQPNASVGLDGSVTLAYEVGEGASNTHWTATSPDGAHFGAPSRITNAGLPTPEPTWGSLAYDTADGRWYALFNADPTRPPSTTGGVVERGQSGVVLYATSDLAAGTWQELDTVDTNLTGYESNFLGGILRDGAGTVYTPGLPGVEVYVSTSNPRPAANATPAQRGAAGAFNSWDIFWSTWSPNAPLRALARYYSGSLRVHEVSTGWVDTSVFGQESVLAHLYEAPSGQFTKPLYGCVAGNQDYFISQGSACEGRFTLGLAGYLSATAALGLVELYRCNDGGGGHFVSLAANCEGRTTEGILGWATP